MPYTVSTYTVSMTLSMYSVKKKTFISQHVCLISNCQWCIWKVFQTPFKHQNNISKVHVYPELRMNSSLSPLCMYTRIQCQKKCAGGCPCIIILVVFFWVSLKLPSTILKLDTGGKSASVEFRRHHHIFRQRVQQRPYVFSGKKATNFQHNL